MIKLTTALVVLTINLTYGQLDREYNKYNALLGKEKTEAIEILLRKHKIDRVMHMKLEKEKQIDSLKLVFETKKHTYILSCVNDTVKYISVVFGTQKTIGLMDKMKETYSQDSLYNLKDDYLNYLIKKLYSTAGLFVDKERKYRYLVIAKNDPQYSAQPSTMIIWRRESEPHESTKQK